jgi:ribosomal protein S12 methylthiotransferase
MITATAWSSSAWKHNTDLLYFLDPFGCAKNQVDAENMMAYLNGGGWSAASDAADADLVIVNSCGFIESAKQESINAVLGWRKLYPGKKILLAGCLAQRYAKELAEALPEADGFFGTEDITKIVDAASSIVINDAGIYDAAGASPRSPIPEPCLTCTRPLLSLPGSAYVKISEGCNNRCSYCAIPLIRGPLCCRAAADIVDECKGLLARGIKELCIIGQDIGSYRYGHAGLPELLAAIAELSGDFWVRLLYMHPDHFPIAVIDIMEKDPRFLPYFDIPFQHGSKKTLSAMNRTGDAESYIALVETIRKRLFAAVIRTTFLVGFPGETEDDFALLTDFQEKLRADWAGCFAYSREEDTPAYTMKPQVSKKTRARRKREIEERQVQITEKNMDRFVGQTLNALFEEKFSGNGTEGEDIWLGRLYCHAPEVDGAAVITGVTPETKSKAGDLLPCRVIARRGIDLEVVQEKRESGVGSRE